MARLADLLELMHGARGRTRTVRATVRTWRHVHRMRQAMERSDWVSYGPAADDPEPEAVAHLARVWLAPPDRAREEQEGPDGSFVGVRDGDRWWRYDDHNGAMSNAGQPDSNSGIGDEYRWLIDAATVIGLLEFGEIARGARAGRPALQVKAVPRALAPGEDGPLMRLGALGADELLLDVDAERGALLRIESRFAGQPFAISEVTEAAFDEELPDDTFVFRPPPGEEVRSIAEQSAIEPGLTIEQAVARAPFTVWIPERVPAGWEAEIAFAAPMDRPPAAAHVFLHYRAPHGAHGYSITESPADTAPDPEAYGPPRPDPWQEVTRGGRTMQVREPAEHWHLAQVELALEDTRILIHSNDLKADALADVAAGLVRAPSAPPDL
jgi:outer membrane lipoprotein-sorting protein